MLRNLAPLTALALAALVAACGDADPAAARIGSVAFAPDEIGQSVASIESPHGHGAVAAVNGYLMVIDSSDSGGTPDDGGIEFWDASDPRAPVRVARYDDERTHRLREPHGFGFACIDGATYLALQTLEGMQIWDVTRAPEIELCADLDLPGIEGGNYAGNWWVTWQAPYCYVAGRNAGLYVVDASDPYAPVLANHLPTGDLGGVGPSVIQAVGNLLVLTSNPNGRILTMDASDPLRPAPIQVEYGPRGYSHHFSGGLLLEPGGQGDPESLYVFEVGHEGSISGLPPVGTALGDGGYGAVQDGVFHAGFSDHALRFDLGTMELLGSGTIGVPGADEDFATPFGELHLCQQRPRGTLGPCAPRGGARYHRPRRHVGASADGATGQALTTRVGLSMSDQIDVRSLGIEGLRLRRTGGDVVPCVFCLQAGTINLSPLALLELDAEYTVEVDAVRDVAGNTSPGFRSTFRTTDASGIATGQPVIEVQSPGAALVGDTVIFDVDAIGGAPATSYVWDFGDGSEPTAPSPFPAASHAYAEPGRYTALCTAENNAGQGGAAAIQVVHRPLDAVSPRTSSSIAEGALHLFLANHDADTVTAILGSTSARVWEVPVPERPTAVGVDPSDRVWVTCKDADAVAVLDGTSGATVATIALDHGAAPTSLVFPPGEDAPLVVLEGDGRVIRLGLDGTVLASADVGPRPRGLAVTGDGSRVLVTRFLSRSQPARVLELDGSTLAAAHVIELADDPGPDAEASGRGRPNYLASVAITPDGHSAFVASKKDNIVRGAGRDGLDLDFESTVRTAVSRVDLAAPAEALAARVDLNDRALAQAVLPSPRGDLLFVACLGSDVVDVIDTWSGAHVAELPVGAGPRGLAFNGLGRKLYVHETLDRTVAVFDTRELQEGRSASATLLVRTSLVASEPLAPAVLRGKRLFHAATDQRMARDGYHACAGCHLDGGGDGTTWDFTQLGEGLRGTIPLHGRAGLGHGLLHWTANFDEVQDFEGPIRSLGGGLGFLDAAQWAATSDPLGAPKAGLSADLDDLAAYVASLDTFPRSPHREPNGARTAAGLRGEAVFLSEGCSVCHSGTDYTDGLRHDVGTALPSSGQGSGAPLAGVGFETPTLRGVWATAPYLHDGRLGTLLEVLELPGHGAGLNALDRSDLGAFLSELE